MDMSFLHKFYAASVSIGLDGSMLIASTRERMLAWAMMFCFIAAFSLISYLICRRKSLKQLSLSVFCVALIIPIIIIPSFRNESIQVNREQIVIRSGTWFLPSEQVIRIDKLRQLRRVNNEYLVSNLIGDDYITWYFESHNGEIQELVLNDFFSAHSMAIAHYIRDRGYPVDWLAVSL